MVENSFELMTALKDADCDRPDRDEWWWSKSGTVSALIGAILTQNTKWESVEISLDNLKRDNLLSIETLASLSSEDIHSHIKPSGFFRNKAKNIILICRQILEDFGTFESFKESVEREWLLRRRGIGPETADSILNYTCYKEAFVVDSYTNRLLTALGYRFDSYDTVQEWMIEGIYERYDELFPGFGRAKVYARCHGMIVEYCKTNRKGREIDISKLST